MLFTIPKNINNLFSSKFKLAVTETFFKAKLSGLVVSSQVTLFNTKANVIRGFVDTVELKNRKLVSGLAAESLPSDVTDVCHSFEVCNETQHLDRLPDPVMPINHGELFLLNVMITARSSLHL